MPTRSEQKRKKRNKPLDPATKKWVDEDLKPGLKALMKYHMGLPSALGVFTKDQLLFHIPEQLIDDEMRQRIAPFRPEDILLRLVDPRQEREEETSDDDEKMDAFAAELTKHILGEKF